MAIPEPMPVLPVCSLGVCQPTDHQRAEILPPELPPLHRDINPLAAVEPEDHVRYYVSFIDTRK